MDWETAKFNRFPWVRIQFVYALRKVKEFVLHISGRGVQRNIGAPRREFIYLHEGYIWVTKLWTEYEMGDPAVRFLQ